MKQQHTIQLPAVVAGNEKCHFAHLIGWDKRRPSSSCCDEHLCSTAPSIWCNDGVFQPKKGFPKREASCLSTPEAEEWPDQVETIANDSLNRNMNFYINIPILVFNFTSLLCDRALL
jgi:hypothetical protein